MSIPKNLSHSIFSIQNTISHQTVWSNTEKNCRISLLHIECQSFLQVHIVRLINEKWVKWGNSFAKLEKEVNSVKTMGRLDPPIHKCRDYEVQFLIEEASFFHLKISEKVWKPRKSKTFKTTLIQGTWSIFYRLAVLFRCINKKFSLIMFLILDASLFNH